MNKNLEIIFDEKLLVGESPVWDEKAKKLCFVDIRGNCYYSMDYKAGEYQKFNVPQMLGCMAMCENGDFLLSMEDGIYRTSKNGDLHLAHQKIDIKGERFNDGKVGPDGAYYVGTAGENFSGAFYRLADGELIELFDGCGCSNGIDWTANAQTMFYCDSREQRLEKFVFDKNLHTLSGRKTVCEIDESLGCGDGCAIDAEGNIWLAVWGGSCILHIEGTTGHILDKIDIPARQVSSCCFAGDNLDDLIVTTASVRTNETEDPLAGKVFRLKVETHGCVFERYKY